MRKISFTILLLLSAGQLFAQKDSLAVKCNWKDADFRDYKVTKITTRTDDSSGTASDTISYTFRLFVLSASPDGSHIQWLFEDTPFADYLTEDEYEDLGNQYGDLELDYSTYYNGRFRTMENWQDVSKYLNLYYDVKHAYDPSKDSTNVIENFKRLKEQVSTQEGVNQMFEELYLLHMAYGYKIAIGDTLKYNRQAPLEPFDERVTGHVRCYFDNINRRTNEATLNFIAEADKDEASRKITELLKNYADKMPDGTDAEKHDKSALIQAIPQIRYQGTDMITYTFDLTTGFPSKVHMKHVLNFDVKVDKSNSSREVIIERQ
jgi:hypothetical protein